MNPANTLAMTTAEGIVAATVIVAVTAVVLLVVWQMFGLARRGMDRHDEQPGRSTGNRSADRGDQRGDAH